MWSSKKKRKIFKIRLNERITSQLIDYQNNRYLQPYNVYAPKAERNRATHLNHVTRTVYPLGYPLTVQTAARRELTRADASTRSHEH